MDYLLARALSILRVTPSREARDMCMTCDGYTDEEQHRWRELTILTQGWIVLGVEPSEPNDPTGGWAFTVGGDRELRVARVHHRRSALG